MATHAGVALELGIKRAGTGSGGIKMMSPQMEAILIWCQCRTRDYVRHDTKSLITNSSDSFTNLEFRIHEFLLCFFFQLANCFGPITSSFSFWTTQTEKNSWKKLVKQIGENIWWIRYKLYLFDCHLLNRLEFNSKRVVCKPWLFHFGIEINSNL